MEAGGKIEVIYVELDCLLDTRIGTLAVMKGDEYVAELLASGKYHSRDIDGFPDVDREAYQAAYKKRGPEELMRSSLTGGVSLIKQLVGKLSEQAAVRPYHDGCKILINTHPFNLADNVRDELKEVVEHLTLGLALVEMVYMTPEEVSPLWCKQELSAMMMYEYESWLNLHAQTWQQIRIPTITLFSPRIYHNKKPTEQELQELLARSVHPFAAIEMMASPVVELRLMDVKHFSVVQRAGEEEPPV